MSLFRLRLGPAERIVYQVRANFVLQIELQFVLDVGGQDDELAGVSCSAHKCVQVRAFGIDRGSCREGGDLVCE